MENKPMQFTSISKEPDSKDFSIGNLAFKGENKKVRQAKKRAKLTTELVKQLQNTEIIPMGKGVSVVIFKDKGITITKDSTLNDIIMVEAVRPEAFVGLLPSLYEDFINNDIITPHVNVGDFVKIKKIYKEKKGDIARKVKSIYLKALNDMTVIIAELEDGDLVLTNTLIKCN